MSGIIGVYDNDFMKYAPVVTNLECAKLCAYYRKKQHITVLAPELDPSKYTEMYVRKDYDDGIYPKELFQDNVEYGGFAFSRGLYVPLPEEIELTEPNMEIYRRYESKFGKRRANKLYFSKLMNGRHMRLSMDGRSVWDDYLKPTTIVHSTNTIFFHDYDLGKIEGSTDVIEEVTRRYNNTNGKYMPRRVGMKFPVQVNSREEFYKWFNIAPSFDMFFLQYNGLMDDDLLLELYENSPKVAKQFHYKIGLSSYTQDVFMKEILPKVYHQILFLRSRDIKILLKYDDDFMVEQEVKDLIRLFNNYLSRTSLRRDGMEAKPGLGTLHRFVSSRKTKKFQHMDRVMNLEDIRNCFQFVREKNYEVFKLFYESEEAVFKGGELECLKLKGLR